VTTAAVTFWYNWLFNRTGGSVLLLILAHDLEGSIQAQGWMYMGVWLAVAIGLVVFDRKAWRAPRLSKRRRCPRQHPEKLYQPRPPRASSSL
jgi:hypothetical protein